MDEAFASAQNKAGNMRQYEQFCESEGVLMIIQYDAVFGYISVIIFQLKELIAVFEKPMKSVLRKCIDMLGFSHLAIPTRHEVNRKPYLQEDNA